MNARFAKGLVVGKFCPLHAGHELLINHALRCCDQVIVISYTKPEFDRCGPDNRERWITEVFPTVTLLVIDDARLERLCLSQGIATRLIPHNDAPASEHRELVAWLCLALLHTTIDAVFTSENYGDGFAQALTAYFHDHGLTRSPVQHVCVDRDRAAVPVSGTLLRSEPDLRREFLAPIVYADFVRRVVILGGESSGKTTLAQALAHDFKTVWVPEYGRELWEQRSGRLLFEDMLLIARTQVIQEQLAAQRAQRWLFCDTSPLTTLFYSLHMFGKADTELERLAGRHYDDVLLCAPDYEFVQDGTRQDASFRMQQYHWYCRELEERHIRFCLIEGPLDQRLHMVTARLEPVS